jgi:hypothetical protein
LRFENCSVCGKGFTTKSGLYQHFQTHCNDSDENDDTDGDFLDGAVRNQYISISCTIWQYLAVSSNI